MSLIDDAKDLPTTKWANFFVPSSVTKRVQSLIPRARQFIFDEQASEMLGKFMVDCTDILVEQAEFARQPYEVTYIEVDLEALHRGARKPFHAKNGEETDWKIGFLAHEGIIANFMNSHTRPTAYMSPLFVFDNEYLLPAKKSDGSNGDYFIIPATTEFMMPSQDLYTSDRFNFALVGSEEYRKKTLKTMGKYSLLDAYIYLSALLMLYQRHKFTLTEHGPHRALSKGKQRVYMAHTVVTIHLSQYEEAKRQMAAHADRSAPRRHEVRTHYKHRHLTAGCIHEWSRVEDAQNEQWRCTHCSGLRWLCREHLRGDGAIGFVNKRYEITA